jgi:hypothetical protein
MRKTKTLLRALLLLLFAPALSAQVNLEGSTLGGSPFYCESGVTNKAPSKAASFTYAFNPDYKMLPPNTEQPTKVRRNERFDTRLKLPVVNAEQLKVVIGMDYTLERYHFLGIGPDQNPLFKHLNQTELKNTGINASIFRPFNHKYYALLRLSANWQGDYTSFATLDRRYAVYNATSIFGVKKRDDLEYGVGLLINQGFRGRSAVPFAFYNHTFNDHWGIETVLPTTFKLRYNFSDRHLAMLGTELNSQNYALSVQVPSPSVQTKHDLYHFRRASFDVVALYYLRLTDWTWLQLKGGYAFDNNSAARDLPKRLTHNLKPSGSMVGMVSVFISPPKHCVEKTQRKGIAALKAPFNRASSE